jgi:hypothetical protein
MKEPTIRWAFSFSAFSNISEDSIDITDKFKLLRKHCLPSKPPPTISNVLTEEPRKDKKYYNLGGARYGKV